ncbi:MAG: sigma-70 family RNA polymerase sigma factor [Planctomycetes bacterium]|nr:sigma-70 family RNA polymerase sigma factor [Planctomycetota bacterium]
MTGTPTPKGTPNAGLERLAGEADRAYCTALRVTGNPALAEEVVQETFLQLLRKPPRDQGPEALLAYFLKAVHGRAVNALRASHRDKRREESFAVGEASKSSAPAGAEQREMARAAQESLERLPSEERVAVSLCCEQGLTRRVASGVLGIPERTVSKRVERGLEKLRSLLTAQGYASVAALGIAGALGELGAVPAPAGLSASLAKLAAGGGLSLAGAGTKGTLKVLAAKKAAGASLGAQAALAAVLVAAAGGAFVALRPKPQPPRKPAAAPAPPPSPQPAAVRRVWHESFEDLKPWIVTAWREPGGIQFEQVLNGAYTPPACLRFTYTFPRLKPQDRQMDEWLANHRTFERTLTVARGARRGRFWMKVLSNGGEAEFNLALYPADRKSAWSYNKKLAELGAGWTQLEFDLKAMPKYWKEDESERTGHEVPPLDPGQIAFMEIGMNWADGDVLLDEIEFVTDPEPVSGL